MDSRKSEVCTPTGGSSKNLCCSLVFTLRCASDTHELAGAEGVITSMYVKAHQLLPLCDLLSSAGSETDVCNSSKHPCWYQTSPSMWSSSPFHLQYIRLLTQYHLTTSCTAGLQRNDARQGLLCGWRSVQAQACSPTAV